MAYQKYKLNCIYIYIYIYIKYIDEIVLLYEHGERQNVVVVGIGFALFKQ